MTSEMKIHLFDQMQEAIEEAVSDSNRIGEIIAEMKRSGYDLSLVLDSTLTISPSDDGQRDMVPEPRLASNGELTLTNEDLNFLRDLKILV